VTFPLTAVSVYGDDYRDVTTRSLGTHLELKLP
jgi:hypothetical protein